MNNPARAESALLAAMLVDPSRIPLVAGKLTGEAFDVTDYGEAFDTMVRMSREGRRIDAVTLAHEGVDLGDLALVETGTAVEEYADLIREGAFRRAVSAHLHSLQRAVDAGLSRTDIMGKLSTISSSLVSEGSDSRVYDTERAVAAYVDIMERRKMAGVGLPYGIAALDRWLQPAHGGDLIVVAARPSIGKTALAEHIADSWAFESDLPVMFMSIEMSLGQLMDRAVSRWGGIPSSHIVRGIMSQDEEHRAKDALELRRSVNLWYVDNPYATTDTIRSAAAEVRLASGGIRAIIVDYLQLLKDSGDNDNQRIGRISRNIKALAREYDCPVLVLSQLNRQAEYRDDPHPRLSDIRDSGAVEQDADVVLGLYRTRGHDIEDNLMDIDILKNRQGPLARITVEFDGDYVRFNTEE